MKTQLELIMELSEIAAELGWAICLPQEDDIVPGLIVGTPDFVNQTAPLIYGDKYDLLVHDGLSDGLVEMPSSPDPSRKGRIVH